MRLKMMTTFRLKCTVLAVWLTATGLFVFVPRCVAQSCSVSDAKSLIDNEGGCGTSKWELAGQPSSGPVVPFVNALSSGTCYGGNYDCTGAYQSLNVAVGEDPIPSTTPGTKSAGIMWTLSNYYRQDYNCNNCNNPTWVDEFAIDPGWNTAEYLVYCSH